MSFNNVHENNGIFQRPPLFQISATNVRRSGHKSDVTGQLIGKNNSSINNTVVRGSFPQTYAQIMWKVISILSAVSIIRSALLRKD